MNDSRPPASFPDLLAGHLAKLDHQLRHLLSGPPAGPAERDPASVAAVLGRLRVAATLLTTPGLAAGREMEPLHCLGAAVSALVVDLAPDVARVPASLVPPLTLLAGLLGESFDRLDAGEAPAAICNDPRWEATLAAFINAGTVLQGLDEIEEQMQAWSRRYGEQDLSASQEDALRRRWLLVRAYGDTLFGAATDAAGPGARPYEPHGGPEPDSGLVGRRVMLLLDSPFRRAQLVERLREAGCAVEIAECPADMLARVEDPLPPQILLCDNVEPTRHLAAVQASLSELEAGSRPVMVLIATVAGGGAKVHERARQMGALCTWADPFRPRDLAAALH